MGLLSGGINNKAGTDAAGAQIQGDQEADAAYNYYAGLDTGNFQQFMAPVLNSLLGQYYQGQNQLTNYTQQGVNQLAPYNLSGANALDAYDAALGLPTVKGGSFNLQQALNLDTKNTSNMQTLNNIKSEFMSQSGVPASNINFTGDYTHDLGVINNQVDWLQNSLSHGAPTTGTGSMSGSVAALQAAANQQALGMQPGSNLQGAQNQPGSWALGVGPQNFPGLRMAPSDTASGNQTNLSQYSAYLGGPQAAANAPASVLSQFNNQFMPYSPQQTAELGTLLGTIQNQLAQMPDATMTPEQQQLVQQYNSGNLQYNKSDPQAIANQLQSSPGYQFQLQQGTNAVTNNAAANGLLNSTQFAKGLNQYGQGLADNTYQQYLSNLASAAGQGLSSSTSQAGMLSGLGSGLSNLSANLGNNLSSAYSSMAQNFGNILQGQGTTAANSLIAQGQAQAAGLLNNANLSMAQSAGNSQLFGALGSAIGPSLFGSATGAGALGTGLSAGSSSSLGGAIGGLLGGL